jgi:putative FmdB family regulatory protein
MPIYEYSCKKCGKTIEVIQKMSDKPLKTHAGCGGKLDKLISAAGFQFKGTGWYVTDYARKSHGEKSEKTESAAETKADSSKTSESSGNGAKDKPAATSSTEKSEKPAKSSASGKSKKS